MTPYELAMSPVSLQETGVLLCTAGGSNPDVLSCFDAMVRREPALLAAICTRLDSPLAKAALASKWAFCHEFDTPVRKDGFLATNSLLATVVLLVRAYENIYGSPSTLPPTISELLNKDGPIEQLLEQLESSFRPLSLRATLTVLHGGATQPAAVDLESRFTEAALGNVQLADYRNFAHGRHNWLARKADETAVLILSSPEDKTTAERTALLLPKSIPQLHLQFPSGFNGTLSAVLHSIYLGWFSAKAHGIDPGKPKVPQFGRKLYHLRAIPKSPIKAFSILEHEAVAIEKKTGLAVQTLHARNQLHEWLCNYQEFRNRITKTRFNGIIFDYDGTLCGSAERFVGIREEIADSLEALLRAGIPIGIATGRGKSAKDALRAIIRSRSLQKLVLMGYHNAGEIGSLNDDTVPPESSTLHGSLQGICEALAGSVFVTGHSRIQAKGQQITVEAISPLSVQPLWDSISDIMTSFSEVGIRLVRSTHSIDVLAPSVSKRSLLVALAERLRMPDPKILCVGDRGRWPGNDFELLQHPFSLSVDQSSIDPSTCWNLSPPSSRYDDACLHYLKHMKVEKKSFSMTGLGGKSS
jgi:hypothetical protein